MSVGKIEVVMDGTRPLRTLVTAVDGTTVELAGVTDFSVEVGVGDLPHARIELYAEVTIRNAYPEELA